ncbi:DUF6159 family protein [Haloarchaeobius sp. TZWWS8]|uniref:DUF6159 family protein n=1 Tax=Haloarchaeobius sp. TZWWS8 TaxID=3446121 RepID=UPI003EB8B318
MSFFARLKFGWHLAMDSVGVLRKDPELLAFPLVAGVAGTVYLVLLLGGSSLVVGTESGPLAWVVLFALYLGSTFIASFFTAGLMHESREAFRGRDPSLRNGLAAAWRNVGTLFAWAVIAATVGVLLRVIRGDDTVVGDILAGLVSVAWGILTYFVVPVVVFEDVSIGDAIRRSGETFKRTWGETAGAGFGVGLVSILFTVVGVGLAIGAFALLGGSGAGFLVAAIFAVVVVLGTVLVGQALTGIAKTALYVYATEGTQPAAFDDVDFRHTVR